jgi:hypothetical protein
MFKKLAVAAAALALFFPSIALAQDAPPPEDAPSYAQQQEQSPDEQIRGRVVAFDGGYALTVQDERGYQDNVQLHQGTIINPTGLTLEPGMTVSILGYNAGAFFAANEIDTPYQFVAGVPYFYGHPYFYYGPSVSLDFFFGRGGWWHPEYFGGGFRYVGGARFYNSVRIGNVYGGNGYYGGAPRERRVSALALRCGGLRRTLRARAGVQSRADAGARLQRLSRRAKLRCLPRDAER